ncbi:TPA_exp: Uncharacterized protein A8136_4014 [Trichophyton benhamiae CBS 112371]|uniref:YjgH family protein n=1 Tax=Arthroderma benhamiae (strain ATCC MYA-4681 / CBS 112371) TaxID=663331 RepID=D4B249_ARTBC|nr:uncharacterized protein ARB_02532 [Trichophyton benhamiae CBS 112371]EFE30610.1 hypothetical protein ARB_02532 [Trichophyton benhamiae CBS 112371]DAA73811.1 TPA_exp: Uncharacterized protein A8136_4014 [Trichophyton benhamiae CBS 112371]
MDSQQVSGTVSKPSPTSQKTFYKTPSHFEQVIGYYRGVRHGQHIFISGTTAVNPNKASSAAEPPQVLFPGDAKKQTIAAFEECLRAVTSLGGNGVQSVVRVRMFVGRHEDCGAVGEAFTEIFGDQKSNANNTNAEIGTAATMLVVQNGFINRDMMVEVEVDAMAVE